MVVKALSWALRELAKRDPASVVRFMSEEDGRLAARVRREVQSKIETGRKARRRLKAVGPDTALHPTPSSSSLARRARRG
jgi:hypothetical protein